MQMTKTKYTHINTNESTHSEMDPVRQNPIQSWTDWQSWSFFLLCSFFCLSEERSLWQNWRPTAPQSVYICRNGVRNAAGFRYAVI